MVASAGDARCEVKQTRPYVDTEVEIGVPGTEVPDPLGGERIWVKRNSEAVPRFRGEEDAVPVAYDELSQVDGPALLHTVQIDAIGYDRMDYILHDDEHAIATPTRTPFGGAGELLLDRGEEAEDLLHVEAELQPAPPEYRRCIATPGELPEDLQPIHARGADHGLALADQLNVFTLSSALPRR